MIAKKNKKIIFLAAVVFLFFVVVIFSDLKAALAEEGFGSMSGYLNDIATNVDLKKASVPTMIGKIIYGILGLLGVFSLLLVIYAGLKWMLADGNEETVSQSKKIILYAIIGVLIIMGSYAVTYYVIDKVIQSTQSREYYATPRNAEVPGVGNPVPVGCTGDNECPDCTYGVRFCDQNTGVCGCRKAEVNPDINSCIPEDCADECRGEGQGYVSGYCDSYNICQCI
ncbi:hypothetical protein GYA54_00055 [Candidatus Kuenenbacteria bacterium]|nr:hypothetical protein [Candidatus Kuenenbacteria bacterium]